jgi:hypothetical protein
MGLTPNDGKTGRTYTWGDEVFVSVTTVLGCLNKPALPGWAAREAANFVVNNFPVVSDLVGRRQKAAAVDLIKGSPWRARDKAADVGTTVHKAVEALIAGTEPDVTEEEIPFLVQFSKFIEAFKPEILVSEGTVFNRQYNYAGTMDLILRLDGKTWLVDVKSGKGIYPEYAMQVAAYARGDFIGMPDGTEEVMPIIDKGAILHLQRDSYHFVPVAIGKEVFESFLYCREMFRWQDDISHRVLLPEVRR